MAIADDVQRPAGHQRCARLKKHPPGKKVADHLLLMEGWVAQHHIQRIRLLHFQTVSCSNLYVAITQRRLPVLGCRLHGHERLVDQCVVRLRVVQRTGDGQYAVTATQVRDPCRAKIFWQMRQESAGADV